MVAALPPRPKLTTVAVKVKDAPGGSRSSLTVTGFTSRSGVPLTSTRTPFEQSSSVLASLRTLVMQAP